MRDGYGIFCLGGKDRIVPNQEFTIYSRYVTYKVQVLSIHEND